MPPKAKKPKKQDSKSSLDTGKASKAKKTKTEDTPAPAPLTRQSSNDYGEWYHHVPDEDVWGDDADDPWGDNKDKKKPTGDKPTKKVEKDKGGKRSKEPKDEVDDDEFGAPGGDDWGDEPEGEQKDEDEEEDEAPVTKTAYRILDSKSILKKRNKVIEENAEMLGLSNDEMDLLLRYLRYDKKKIEQFLGDSKNQDDVRLQSGIREKKVKPATTKTVQCSLYCSVVPLEEAHCLTCGHYTCNDCWTGFLESEINAGVNSVFSKCPAQDEKGNKCQVPIDYATMKQFLSKAHLEKLDQWILDQFVSSSKNVKWCPKAGCGQAVEYDGGDAIDVTCKCKSSFCFHCGGPAHSPAPCDLVKKWLDINNDGEAASERLIQSLTKPCPKCGTRIEKNRHCNHMKCSKCNFDFCWQCMQAITLGTTHPSWYVCKNREQAAQEGKLDTAEEERLNLNKFLSKLSMHKQHVEDCRKDQKNAQALLPKIRDFEGTLGKTLNWLTKIGEKIGEAQRFLEWTWVYSYFMAESNRKETFINWQKILEEKADGMLHDLEKALGDKEAFPKFLNETKRITEIKKSVEVLTSKMQQMSDLADEIASALQHVADTKTNVWSCIRCSKEFADKDKDGKRTTHCGACSACRDHGDFDCLVLQCKKG